MYGAIEDDDDSPPKSVANIAVLRLGIVTFSACNFTSGAIFPFFPIVAQEKLGSVMIVGTIFAILPFATALTSPFVPFMSQTFGRIEILCIGLIGASMALFGFGFVEDYRYWFLLRVIQGVSNAFVDGPAVSLLLAHTNDVSEDVGLMEASAGIAYVIGPAAGGILYSMFGFQNTFVILGIVYLLALGLVPFTIWGLEEESDNLKNKTETAADDNDNDDDENLTKTSDLNSIELTIISQNNENNNALLSTNNALLHKIENENSKLLNENVQMKHKNEKNIQNFQKHEENEIEQHISKEEEEFSAWRVLLSEPAVWIGSAASTLVWTTTCFYDIALSQQLKLTLGLSASSRGLVYVCPSVVYATFSLYLGGICKKYGAHNVLIFGSLLHSVVFFACGPNPLMILIADVWGFGGAQGRTFSEISVMFAMSLWGFAMAPLFQAGLPLMHEALDKKGFFTDDISNDVKFNEKKMKKELDFNIQGSLIEESEQQVMLEEEEEDQKQDQIEIDKANKFALEKEIIEDALSALQQGTAALGAILGPILGGLGLDYLPHIEDPGCIHTKKEEKKLLKFELVEDHCSTGFAWTTTVIALIYLLLALCIKSHYYNDNVISNENKKEEEKDEAVEDDDKKLIMTEGGVQSVDKKQVIKHQNNRKHMISTVEFRQSPSHTRRARANSFELRAQKLALNQTSARRHHIAASNPSSTNPVE